MKKCRFLWSAHRITERQKAGKSRSIKGKQLKNSRNQVSKQLVVLHSSANVNLLFYSERDLFTPQNEIVLRSFYIRGQRIRVCAGTSRWKAAGKILERFWQDCGKTMADCQDNLSDSE